MNHIPNPRGADALDLHAQLAELTGMPHVRDMLPRDQDDAIQAAADAGIARQIAQWLQTAYDTGLVRGRQVERNAQVSQAQAPRAGREADTP